MIKKSLFSFLGLAACVLGTCIPLGRIYCKSVAHVNKIDLSSDMKNSLRRALQSLDNDRSSRYVSVFQDLNGDGRAEAVVYMLGEKWCGSGGCDTLVLTRWRGVWKVVSVITITRPPISVLAKRSHGWNSLGVWVAGGGIDKGYEAELDFNGKSYPRNPTTLPAVRLVEPARGVVISSVKDAEPLY